MKRANFSFWRLFLSTFQLSAFTFLSLIHILHILHPKLIPGTVGVERIGSVCGLIIDHLPHTLAEQGIGIGLVALIVGLAVRHEEFHDEYPLFFYSSYFGSRFSAPAVYLPGGSDLPAQRQALRFDDAYGAYR